MADVNIEGQTIHYTERGHGTPLMLVHGFPLDGRMWEGQLNALADQCRVIVPDLPGFGQSRGGGPFTMESLAGLLHIMLDRLSALPCILGGLSMGGYVSLAYVQKYPNDLNGLMLLDTRADADNDEGKRNRGKMIDAVRAGGSKVIADQMQPKMIAPGTPQRRPDVLRRLRQIMEECPPLTIEHALMALRDRTDHTAHLMSIAVPTLVIVGQQDAITPPAVAEGMHGAIAGSRLTVIPDAGHLSPMEQPGAVAAAIGDFVGRLRNA